MQILLILGAIVAMFFIGAMAQQPLPARDAGLETSSVQGYGDRDATCLEWADACRICRRPENGEAVCSNIGIACQPAAVTCTRRGEEKK